MNPKSIAVTWETTTTFTYNGQPQAPTVSATSGITGETINVTRTTGTNAGSYTSTASISSVTGGRARKENYTLTGNTKAFTINKANATMTDPTLVTGLVYNTRAQNLISKAGNGAGGTIKYGLGANNTTAPTTWNTSVTGTDAGTYYVWSKVDADGNHNNVGAKYIGTVTIAKATVTIPTSPVKQYTYNGKAQAHGYTLPTGTAIENNGTTPSAIDAGTYNIVLKLTSTSNYQWSDKTTTNKTINWKINPKAVTVTWGATTFTYNGQPQAPTASATSGITGETINVTRTTGTNAGSYTSTASISSVTGGRARKENYTLTGTTKAFTINKANATMTDPTLATGLVYNTKAQNLIAKAGNGAGGTIKYGLGANNTTAPTTWNTSVTGTDAGTYYVWSKVDADGNHNNVGAKYIGTVTIAKATVTIPTSPVKQYTYNGKAQAHGYTLPTGTAIENNGTTPSAIDAGTYNIVLKLTSTSNYQWSDKTTTNKTINWKINPKSVTVTWGATSFTYNGQAQAPTASATSGVTGETINVTRTTGRNAGSYTSTASISSVTGGRAKAGNYALSGNTKAFTINKVNATMTNPALATGLVYNTKAQSLLSKAGSASGGTIKYGLGANSTTAPTSWNTSVTGTNAGTYFVWTKVDADGNHNGVAAKYIGMVTIAKATVTIPGSPVKAYTYTGSAISHGYTAPTGSAIETGTTGSATDAGTYNIVLKITNTSNYQWNDKTTANKTVNWKINPKSVAVSWGTTTFNYTGRAQAPTASAASGVTGETINVTRTSAIKAGTYTSKASISSVTGGREKAENYTLTGNTKAFTINKVAATNPTLTSVSAKYDKNAHEITVSGGSGGTIYYRTSTDNSSWGSWNTTKPSRTSIGTTYVQAYVVGDGNHTNTSETGSATITITNPTAADVSYTPSDSSWNVENVKQALDDLYNR